MKPPPLLLGAALLFWGWQSDFLIVGAVMAVVLESARFLKARWEFSDEDFSRVWTFCSLLFLAAAVYAFTDSNGPANFGSFFQNPSVRTQAGAGLSTARTGASLFRWLPMIFFPFLAMQTLSTRDTIPLATISFIVRRRRKRARQAGRPAPASLDVPIGHAYFAATLLAASLHAPEDNWFFWGLCGLLAWALWAQRSRRFAFAVWLGALLAAITLGYLGQHGIVRLQTALQNVNPEFFARLMRRRFSFDPAQSRTALGSVGDLKSSGAIVVRLETRNGSSPPTYLRAASYRSYKSPVWFAGSSKDEFETVTELPAESRSWPLLPAKTNTARLNIACYLEGRTTNSPAGLLPLPGGSGLLEHLNAYVLKKNSTGAVLAEGPGLVIFDAHYGPGETIDSPPNPDQDRAVDARERGALDDVIDNLQLRGKSQAEALRSLGAFFATNFTYSTWQGATRIRGTNHTPLSRFLLQTRSGHCEYFATATVLLLRRLEFPARYAVGFAVHEGSGRKYVVRASDAHAWCLVWDEPNQAWIDFDTTPASWVEAEAKRASPWRWFSDLWSRVGFEIARFRWGQSRLRQYLLWIVVPALALLLYQIIFRRGRRRRRGSKPEGAEVFDWPGRDSEFYLLETKLAERGVPRGASEPVSDWLERVAETPDFAALRGPLQELLRLHYRYRFDPLGLTGADREVLKREARACLERLSRKEQMALNSQSAQSSASLS